jgi:hypothetical protein
VTIKITEPARAQDMASVMLGIEGVAVTEVERGPGGRLMIWARVTKTDPLQQRWLGRADAMTREPARERHEQSPHDRGRWHAIPRGLQIRPGCN